MTNVTPAQFEFLHSIDTPTVCNLLEVVAPERRGFGYTVRHLHCPFPDLPPMVGFAKTVTMRAQDRVPLGEAGYMNKRLDYLDYVASQPQPRIAVIQDLDDIVGFGAFWGEVQTNIHKALGCLGTITNGSIRDIPQVAPGFQMLAGSIAPSHAFVHVVDFGGNVNIHGMAVRSGDLIHADRHGAVVVPLNAIDPMKDAAPKLAAKEAQIIDRRSRARASRQSRQRSNSFRARMPARPVAGRERADDRGRRQHVDHGAARPSLARVVAPGRPAQQCFAAHRPGALLPRDECPIG
jgi:regulator of RNase E activity RraA